MPRLARAAAGAHQLAALDELADSAESDPEGAGGLVGGEVTWPKLLRLHGFIVPVEELALSCRYMSLTVRHVLHWT